eukprot:scaffold73360_cov61-Cyclotella_meneghiniana.AAC.10
MFGSQLANKTPSPFVVHNWRSDVVSIGHAPSSMVEVATRRKELHDGSDWSWSLPPLVISVGQVVSHEVMGMANFNKWAQEV